MTQLGVVDEGVPRLRVPLRAVTADARGYGPNLRSILVLSDVVLSSVAWGLALGPAFLAGSLDLASRGRLVAVFVAAVAATLGGLAAGRLYLARACAVRAVETFGVGRASVGAVLAAVFLGQVWGIGIGTGAALLGGSLSFALVLAGRAGYRAWLAGRRRRGESTWPVVLIGTNDEAANLHRLLREHPEYGYEPRGVVGTPETLDPQFGDTRWLGHLDDIDQALHDCGATGVLIAVSAVESDELNELVRKLTDQDVHVHLSSGLHGIAHHRLRPAPVAHEPIFYLEQWALSGWQVRTKRVLDMLVSAVLLIVALPVLLATALGVKLQDGGPVFFLQERVGRNGVRFTVYKFRTMVVDAEARLAELRRHNQRHGPLFKMAQDPRVTPLGRFLRSSSIDELPQLLNVLRGHMSLVGPRPALPQETEQFDDRLLERTQVLPGITGLWQVEARDNPSFWTYKRLDLFYVENWSVGLDLAILFSTAGVVLGRGARAVAQLVRRPQRRQAVVVLD